MSDTLRLPMFGQLSFDIFTVLAGANRRLYEHVVLAIYAEFYRSDIAFPSEAEVVSLVYRRFASCPDLWVEEEVPVDLDRLVSRGGRRVRRRRVAGADEEATGTLIARSRQVYNRLIATGWLEEARYGLKVTVDMPAGAMRLAEFLHSMRDGASEQLGGLVAEVRNAVEAVRAAPAERALGLNKAARDAAAFGRYLRSVLSALREVDRRVLLAENVGDRLRHYFEDFIERVLLRDYAAIATTAHPYRFRHSILRAVGELETSEGDLDRVADAYLEARLAQDPGSARALVMDDLASVRRVFDSIEEAFTRIQQHRGRLETRLRNVVRYAGRRGDFLQRSEALILRLDVLQERRDAALAFPTLVEPRQMVLAPSLLARARGVRTSVTGGDLMLAGHNPVRELRRRLEREYFDRLAVTGAQVARFLERRVPPFGEASASSLWLETLDDFLAFEALRLAIAAGAPGAGLTALQLDKSFAVVASDAAAVNNEWLACPGFSIRRLDDTVTLDARHAG